MDHVRLTSVSMVADRVFRDKPAARPSHVCAIGRKRCFRALNVPHAKLRGQGRAATRPAARWLLPCVLASAKVQFAATVTPCRFCSAEALQRRTEAGP